MRINNYSGFVKTDDYQRDMKRIYNLYRTILMLPSFTLKGDSKELIETTRYRLESLMDPLTYNPPLDAIEDEIMTFDTNAKHLELLRFLKNNLVTSDKILPHATLNMMREEYMSIASSFYESIGGLYFSEFKNLFDKRKDIIWFSKNTDSYTMLFPYFKEGVINIHETKDIIQIYGLVHEFGHLINANLNPNNEINEKINFTEINSIFLEFLLSDFLSKEVKLKTESENFLNNGAIYISSQCKAIQTKKIFIDFFKQNNVDNIDEFKKYKQSLDNYYRVLLDDAFSVPTSRYIKHCVAYPYAISLYQREQKENNSGVRLLEDFTMCDEKDIEKQLKHIGSNVQKDIIDFSMKLEKTQ